MNSPLPFPLPASLLSVVLFLWVFFLGGGLKERFKDVYRQMGRGPEFRWKGQLLIHISNKYEKKSMVIIKLIMSGQEVEKVGVCKLLQAFWK